MTTLLELRERALAIYSSYENLIQLAGKFILTLTALLFLDSRIGYNTTLANPLLAVILAMVCALLPVSLSVSIIGLIIVAQMYALSLETMAVAAALYALILLLYFRFSPKDAIILLLLPVAYRLNLIYAVPIAAGLLLGPASILSVSFGVIVVYFVEFINKNAASITGITTEESVSKFRFVLDGIFKNEKMWVMILAFALTLIIVYVIRRLMIVNSWLLAIGVGSVVNLLVILIGDMVFDTQVSIPLLFLGTVLSFGVAWVIQFMVFNLDYSRTESVQFEDDEYYYYVKAVPKVALSTKSRTVKKISTSREIAHPYGPHSGYRDSRSEAAPEEDISYDYAGYDDAGTYGDEASYDRYDDGGYDNTEDFDNYAGDISYEDLDPQDWTR